ncbi:MAG: Rrf2 family transcriptional regulator, partial [Oscillospiraceae bacterium]|nr:Rrf2 family transcriptional regulator [Oscillospiraceae bacterium]
QLSRAGFVKSVRGAQGGYRLAESPAQYTVGRILRLMEGSLAPVECVDGEGDCSRADRCVTIEVWRALKEAIDNVVDSITLADLVEKYSERGTVDYCI